MATAFFAGMIALLSSAPVQRCPPPLPVEPKIPIVAIIEEDEARKSLEKPLMATKKLY